MGRSCEMPSGMTGKEGHRSDGSNRKTIGREKVIIEEWKERSEET